MDLSQMDWELDLIAAASCMSKEARQAARHSSELLRGFRAALDLDWKLDAAELHSLAVNVLEQPTTMQMPITLFDGETKMIALTKEQLVDIVSKSVNAVLLREAGAAEEHESTLNDLEATFASMNVIAGPGEDESPSPSM